MPHFPAELWAQFLEDVDASTIWKSCRAVSSLVRSEAEREVRRYRLNNLHIRWIVSGETTRDGFNAPFMQLANISRFSEDDTRVYFKTSFGYHYWGRDLTGRKLEDLPWGKSRLEKRFRKAIKYSGLSSADRAGMRRRKMNLMIVFDGLIHDANVPRVELSPDLSEVSFYWKDFLNGFFNREEAYVRRIRGSMNPTNTSVEENEARIRHATRRKRIMGEQLNASRVSGDYERFYFKAYSLRGESYRDA